MTKTELKTAVEKAKAENNEVLETMFNGLAQTKKNKMVKDEKVKKALDRHGVKHE
jgi:hypothetical protein